MLLEENVLLSDWTSFRLGGRAKYFVRVSEKDELWEAIAFAQKENLPYFILGGGSNTIVPDSGFSGLVIKMEFSGIRILSEDPSEGTVLVEAGAGVPWENFVKFTIEHSYSGVECLSGIPGTVGATPIQNVGAYGQDVSETILSLEAAHPSGSLRTFSHQECGFSYRNSRFKSGEWKDWIILSVTFRLSTKQEIIAKYPELRKAWETAKQEKKSENLSGQTERDSDLRELSETVISLRKKKSMVIDPKDPESISAGSFFTNPILTQNELDHFTNRLKELNLQPPQFFPDSEGKTKIPAAWLIENSGFNKGYTVNGVGISKSHSLALVNRGGTTEALLSLMGSILQKVEEKFGIKLEREPILLGS
ncbi:UDP-N-acetylmuramate dehydrogenase [Leptospira idonii]|uniref:UDP-N-acetylenolpyruvoylglucosamine reductase n=1 Tax=Leptospira idonii TaxID=1193500 RepID=A0A4R9M210_9LEPT|nr:UDP-N-acetylmuramate dehydrogenase [Leptospira idonii]TGN19885.1 UDP-N-acetylmuramate dehydrogenase [Leptospira idonii]